MQDKLKALLALSQQQVHLEKLFFHAEATKSQKGSLQETENKAR